MRAAMEEGATDESGELSLLMPAEGDSESTGIGETGDVDELRTKLALAEEELEASRIENQDLESRIAEYRADPPPPDWDGVYVATSK